MKLTFFPPQSSIDPSFWEELYSKKVNVYKLDETEKEITSFHHLLEGWVALDNRSFTSIETTSKLTSSSGLLINFNTIDVSLPFPLQIKIEFI
jgi:hypothetical protein